MRGWWSSSPRADPGGVGVAEHQVDPPDDRGGARARVDQLDDAGGPIEGSALITLPDGAQATSITAPDAGGRVRAPCEVLDAAARHAEQVRLDLHQ